MKKYWILSVLLMCVANIANAETGMFYNVDRSGEGVVLTIKDDTLAFAFFTYFDVNAVNESEQLPVVSPPRPATPEPRMVLPECEIPVRTLPPILIPPTVSPPRPPSTDPVADRNLYGGVPVWYIGSGAYMDGVALGDMYFNEPISYPYSFDGFLSDEHIVASFMMEKNGEGFDLYLDCKNNVPSGLYMCNNVMTFNRLLIGE